MPKVYAIDGIVPVVEPGAFVHPGAVLIGDVIVRARAYGEWGYGFGVTSQYEFLVKQGP